MRERYTAVAGAVVVTAATPEALEGTFRFTAVLSCTGTRNAMSYPIRAGMDGRCCATPVLSSQMQICISWTRTNANLRLPLKPKRIVRLELTPFAFESATICIWDRDNLHVASATEYVSPNRAGGARVGLQDVS